MNRFRANVLDDEILVICWRKVVPILDTPTIPPLRSVL